MEKSLFSRDYGLFLNLLRQTRKRANITQTELGTRLGQTQSFVSKCERGERRLDIVEVRDFCHALGIPFSKFVAELDLVLKREKRG